MNICLKNSSSKPNIGRKSFQTRWLCLGSVLLVSFELQRHHTSQAFSTTVAFHASPRTTAPPRRSSARTLSYALHHQHHHNLGPYQSTIRGPFAARSPVLTLLFFKPNPDTLDGEKDPKNRNNPHLLKKSPEETSEKDTPTSSSSSWSSLWDRLRRPRSERNKNSNDVGVDDPTSPPASLSTSVTTAVTEGNVAASTTAATNVLEATASSPSPAGQPEPPSTPAQGSASPTAPPASVVAVVPQEMDAQTRAAKLRADAEKARLEAERMDAELTLQKITKLERELSKVDPADTAQVETLQREMQTLKTKMQRDLLPPPSSSSSSSSFGVAKPTLKTTPSRVNDRPPDSWSPPGSSSTPLSSMGNSRGADETTSLSASSTAKSAVRDPNEEVFPGILSTITKPATEESLAESIKKAQELPGFLAKSLATFIELDLAALSANGEWNHTMMGERLDQLNRLDFSFSSKEPPTFTRQEIEERQALLTQNLDFAKSDLPETLVDAAGDNYTALALYALEFEYYMAGSAAFFRESLPLLAESEPWLKPVVGLLNKTALDSTVESLYPKCTRKEGQAPTLAQVQQLVTEILPKVSFTCTSKPEALTGGYIVRGKLAKSMGSPDDFIAALDAKLAKSSLADKLTVLYTEDFTVFAVPEEALDSNFLDPTQDRPPVLYVTARDLVREARPFQLSLVSMLGLATCWYLSIYPFLFNPTLAQRVDEQLALADANMTPDLTFLTELSFPLFMTYVTLLLIHEVGHWATAWTNGVRMSVPTFVPSIITGVTSSVTSFKTLPKNRDAMFDIALAGPLSGIVASLAAIAIGTQLTLTSDPATLPALPLEILRQSSLGGTLIDSILGNGALSVPEGALGTRAVAAMTIPLHPVAIAGYINLVVNALSLLPIGTTDGGRIGLVLFGRGAKLFVGNIFLFVTLAAGVAGSDLFLFYFAFCLAFQTGNEIPARNEVDKLSFSRVMVGLGAYVLALLSLIPFQ